MRIAVRFLKLAVAPVILMLVAACGGAAVITGSGTVKSEQRNATGFASIQVMTAGNLVIEQTGEETVTIEAEDNILPLLTSDVSNGRLILGSQQDKSFTATKPINYRVTVKSLDQVVLSGSGNITINPITSTAFNIELGGSGNITAQQFDGLQQFSVNIGGSGDVTVNALQTQSVAININGMGDVTLTGQTDSQLISIRGSGNYNGSGLPGQTAQVNISGAGNVIVNATTTLDVLIGGSGSVTYLGDPQVNQQISGSGSVRKQ